MWLFDVLVVRCGVVWRAARDFIGHGEEMAANTINATLIYVWDETTDRVLLVSRTANRTDQHFGKMNGVGGKLETGESIVGCARRELFEETGLSPVDWSLRGTVFWPGFGTDGTDWFGFVFLVTKWDGVPPTENGEGSLLWMPREELLAAASQDQTVRSTASFELWAGDRHFVPLVFQTSTGQFHAVIPYENGQPVSCTIDRTSLPDREVRN